MQQYQIVIITLPNGRKGVFTGPKLLPACKNPVIKSIVFSGDLKDAEVIPETSGDANPEQLAQASGIKSEDSNT